MREPREYSVQPLVSQDQSNDLNHLVSKQFGYSKDRYFFDDFPIWNIAHGAHTSQFGVYAGAQLVACGGLRYGEVHWGGRRRPVGVVGAIATHHDHRGQGHASRILTVLRETALSRGLEALFLWGAPHPLYQKFGFTLCGRQLRVPISQLKLEIHSRATSIAQVTILDNYHPRAISPQGGLPRTPVDHRWISQQRSVHWHHALVGQEIVASIAWGRGLDLPDQVHEWAVDELKIADPSSRLTLLSQLFQHSRASRQRLGILAPLEILMHPQHELATYLVSPCTEEFQFQVLGLHPDWSIPAKILGSPEQPVHTQEWRTPWLWGLDSA